MAEVGAISELPKMVSDSILYPDLDITPGIVAYEF